jgi:Cys-rich protein (TIGR01571 family)
MQRGCFHLHSNCEENHPHADCCEGQSCPMDGSYLRQQDERQDSSVSSRRDLISQRDSHRYGGWHIYLRGTFLNIAAVASNKNKNIKIFPEQACNDLMTYSLVFGCCCYTCCVRRKLRKLLNIAKGMCDDFLTHITCCHCALVPEWHEIECRG